MKRILNLLTLVVLICLFEALISCSNFISLQGSGHIVSNDRHLSGFDAVKTCCGIDVIINQANNESVVVSVDDNLQEHIKTEVNGKVLNIYCDNVQLSARNIKVYVNLKELVSLTVSSGSDAETSNEIVCDSLQLLSESGSDLSIKLNSKYLKCEASSGSEIKITGSSKSININASSGSSVKARGLSVETCRAIASSGSSVKVNVTKEINADSNSGSDIIVTGNPSIRNVSDSSGGEVKFK